MKTGCPNCGANVVFVPEKQKFQCDHCGMDSDISQFKAEEWKTAEDKTDYDECTCSSCGAKLIVGKNTTITVCVYCGSNQIVTNRFVGDFKPDQIVPFQVGRQQFIDTYRKFLKKRILAPNKFRKNSVISEIKGLYVPFYLFVLNGQTYARGEAKYSTKNSSYYKYFETEYSNVFYSLQDASTKLNDNVMTSLEPYQVHGANDFHPAYLNGFSSENGDENLDELEKKARVRCTNESLKVLKQKLGKYDFQGGNVNVNFTRDSRKYVLLPVWFFNTKYKGKTYEYAVNGQTGKVVGRIPLNPFKFFLTMLLAIVPTVQITLADFASSSDEHDVTAWCWIGTGALFFYILRKYRNVKNVLDNRVECFNEKFKYFNEYSRREYKQKFSKQDYQQKNIKILNDDQDFEKSKDQFGKILSNKVWEED